MTDFLELMAGGLIGASGALIGIFISRYYNLQDKKIEEKRWYAQYLLNLRIESYRKLQISLEDCYNAYRIYGKANQHTSGDLAKLKKSIDELRYAISTISIYFVDCEKYFWIDVLKDMESFYLNIAENKELSDSDWLMFQNDYEAARSCFHNLLNPTDLREYIEKIMESL